MMKKIIVSSLLLLSSAVLFAGYNATMPVTISGDLAYGSLRDARYSADATQYISCYTQHPLGGTTYGSCMARDSSGNYKSCYTTDAAMLAVIQSLGSETDYAWFRTNATGGCERISIVSGSHML